MDIKISDISISIPSVSVSTVTLPSTPTVPTATFALPAKPTMPTIPALNSVISGFPPATPDISGLQTGVTSAISSGQSALNTQLNAATSQITSIASTLKSKESEFKASMESAKTTLLEKFKDRPPTEKEQAQIKTMLDGARTQFSTVKESALAQTKSLQITVEGAPIKTDAITSSASAALNGLESSLTSLGNLLK
jgi:hypothetical protein